MSSRPLAFRDWRPIECIDIDLGRPSAPTIGQRVNLYERFSGHWLFQLSYDVSQFPKKRGFPYFLILNGKVILITLVKE